MTKNKEQRVVSHIVSLVLGIISIVTTLFWYISLPSGITAIVLGAKSYKKDGKILGLAGLITGIVGIVICLLIYLSLFIILLLQNGTF
ncbi:MAG: hypothetical protein IJ193_03215 [Bacilli bacterium]|nr:hypothetical protein [Bacilli bacterium]